MSVNFMENFDFSNLRNYVSNGALKPSPDQYIGELEVNNSHYNYTFHERDTIDYSKDGFKYLSGNAYLEYNVLIVLESPHRYEYNIDNVPIGLAMGKTGSNLFKYFTLALSKSKLCLKDGRYNVILTNAVMYQTSCGLNPLNRKLRDDNWKDIYLNFGGELDFKERIFRIKPRYTFNLCTGGRNPNGLRAIVSKSLVKFGLKKDKHFAEGNHPASWEYNNSTNNAIIY